MTPVEEHICFYRELGLAVTQWAHVEHGIYMIALRCVGISRHRIIGPAFLSIENFRSKLAFVDAAFQAKFGTSKHAVEWRTLRDDIETLAKARNRFVHYQARVFPDAKPGRRYALMPYRSKLGKRKPATRPKLPSGSLFVRDIYRDSRRFATVSNRLLNLYSRLGRERAPFGEDFIRDKPVPSVGQLAREIHGVLGHKL
jgi:hypothetical protein